MDTIFALATPEGKSGVAIVRISGQDAFECFKNFSCKIVKVGRSGVRKLFYNEQLLDKAFVLSFKKGSSFTGEDTVELHLHGSLAIIRNCLDALGQFKNFRAACPGEFTKRAFENGRLDLAQVEGLSDLINAETSVQLNQAQRIFDGALGDLVGYWRSELIAVKALIEASIDFSEEEIPDNLSADILRGLAKIKSTIKQEIKGSFVSERITRGFEVAIIGAPNVGKSTLLNCLSGRKASIISKLAGTTRDVIEVHMDLGGMPITLLDTAGIRFSEDEVEKMGVDLAIDRAKKADLRLFLSDTGNFNNFGLEVKQEDLMVHSKGDISDQFKEDFLISAKTGAGINKLIKKITEIFKTKVSNSSIAINARHRNAMVRAVYSLEIAEKELMVGLERVELCAEGLNGAIKALDSLIGVVDVEDVLDTIFNKFCIGK